MTPSPRKLAMILSFLHVSTLWGCGSSAPVIVKRDTPEKVTNQDTETLSTADSLPEDTQSTPEAAEELLTDPEDGPAVFQLLEPPKKDAAMANALIDRVEMEADVDHGFDIPTLHTQLGNADFLQIIRCKADHVMQLPDGRTLSSVRTSAEASVLEQKKWAWQEAMGDPINCRIVSLAHSLNTFHDISAGAGEHYYAINPCFAPDYVDAASESSCSYRVDSSEIFTVEEGLKDVIQSAARDLHTARAKLAGSLTKLKYNAEVLILNRELCEKGTVVEQRSANLWNGVLQIATVGLTSALATGVGGPFAAPLVAGKISSLALRIFGRDAAEAPSCAALEAEFKKAEQLSQEFASASANVTQKAAALADKLKHTPSANSLSN